MLKKLRSRFTASSRRTRANGQLSAARQHRRLRMETLEDRHLLTVSLGSDQSITVAAGAPLQIPINAVESDPNATLSYSVTSPSGSAITATLPTGNPDLVLNITHTSSGQPGDTSFSGTMVIELYQNYAPDIVAQIESLVNAGDYNGMSFYRISGANDSTQFVIQGGLNAGASSVPAIDDEFSQFLRYTSDGVVGLARQTNHDTGSSEFFISGDPNQNSGIETALDFNYAIFGRVVSDPSGLRAQIQSVPHDNSVGTGDGTPDSPVTITSATIENDNNDLALIVSSPFGTTAGTTGDVTVTVGDSDGNTFTQTFHVTTAADPIDPPPFIESLSTSPFLQGLTGPPTTTVNTPVSFQLPVYDAHGDTVSYQANSSLVANLNVTISNTGLVTATPSSGLVGVQEMEFGVSSASQTNTNSFDTQFVPLFIDPAAPTSVVLKSGGTSTTSEQLGFDSRAGVYRDWRDGRRYGRDLRRQSNDRLGGRHGDNRQRDHRRHGRPHQRIASNLSGPGP